MNSNIDDELDLIAKKKKLKIVVDSTINKKKRPRQNIANKGETKPKKKVQQNQQYGKSQIGKKKKKIKTPPPKTPPKQSLLSKLKNALSPPRMQTSRKGKGMDSFSPVKEQVKPRLALNSISKDITSDRTPNPKITLHSIAEHAVLPDNSNTIDKYKDNIKRPELQSIKQMADEYINKNYGYMKTIFPTAIGNEKPVKLLSQMGLGFKNFSTAHMEAVNTHSNDKLTDDKVDKQLKSLQDILGKEMGRIAVIIQEIEKHGGEPKNKTKHSVYGGSS